jgi:hypothetical protein
MPKNSGIVKYIDVNAVKTKEGCSVVSTETP